MVKINNSPYNPRFEKWSKKQTKIKAKTLFYLIFTYLAMPFKNERAQHYEMKFRRNKQKMTLLRAKNIYHDALIAPVFNMPHSKASSSGKAQKLADQWLKEFYRVKGVEPKPIAYSPLGICNGMSIDIAAKLIHQNKSLDQVIHSLEKGGGSKAYASQIFYGMALKSYRFKPTLQEIIHVMKQTQNAPGAPQLLNYTLEELESLIHAANAKDLTNKWNIEEDPSKKEKFELAIQLLTLCKMLRDRKKFAADRQFKIDDAVPAGNPQFNHWILSSFFILYVAFHTQEAASKRGLKLTHLIEPLGLSGLCESDATYLKNFDQLKNGCYNIMLVANPPYDAHAITLIRENGQDTLIDPNGFILRGKTSDETKKLLERVLSQYQGYNPALSFRPNHRLIIQKYEKDM